MSVPAIPDPPSRTSFLQRHRCAISFVLGLALIAIAALLGMSGQPEASAAFLLAGVGFIQHALGWPTLPELLARWRDGSANGVPPSQSG